MYVCVRIKFFLCVFFAILWASFSYFVAKPWIESLSLDIPETLAYVIIFGIAIIPGFMNAFLVSSLLLDKRPAYKKKLQFENDTPPVSVIIAAYNEEESIMTTLQSIDKQDYPGEIQVIVVNDGSNDNTKKILDIAGYDWLEVIHLDKNSGKSYALNTALDVSKHDLVVSLDADSYQKLSQKASPNAGGDEWPCPLFSRTHFFMLTFKEILFIIVNDLTRVLYEDKNHRSKNQSETLPLRL